MPRTKRETIFDNILDDLQKSVDYFKAYGGTHTLGMVNEDVANAYISRVALYAANAADASAKGLYSDDAEGLFKFEKNANHYYELAYNAAKGLIGKYSLEPNYEDLFTKQSHIQALSQFGRSCLKKTNVVVSIQLQRTDLTGIIMEQPKMRLILTGVVQVYFLHRIW